MKLIAVMTLQEALVYLESLYGLSYGDVDWDQVRLIYKILVDQRHNLAECIFILIPKDWIIDYPQMSHILAGCEAVGSDIYVVHMHDAGQACVLKRQ